MSYNRRVFVKKTALGVSAVFAAPAIFASCKGNLPNNKITLGMIGVV